MRKGGRSNTSNNNTRTPPQLLARNALGRRDRLTPDFQGSGRDIA
jgi:hypothetical protein